MSNQWHTKNISEVLRELETSERGLSTEEALRRLEEYGPNVLPEKKPDGVFLIFLRQFRSPLIFVLFLAGAVVFAMGEAVDAGVIVFVLIFNALVGSVQEGRAQNTLRALRRFARTHASVLRDGREIIVSDSEVVPGDIVSLREGDRVPADCRMIVSDRLMADESALTGESVPVLKSADAMAWPERAASERRNMIFKGTHIVAGSGRAVAVATGPDTAVGMIARQIAGIDTEIPLQADIRALSRLILWVVALIGVLLFAVGIAAGLQAREIFVVVVSLAVSIIPEGLPIVVTLVLATGVWRMSRQNALVKRLQAVEALGQARVIAVDKTGTITRNEMTIQSAWTSGEAFEVGGTGYEPAGDLRLGDAIIDPLNHPNLLLLGKIASLCANARAAYDPENKRWKVFGDPTEVALAVFSEKIGFRKDDLEREWPKIGEIPFDYRTKYHATIHRAGAALFLTVVGAPEAVLERCSMMRGSGDHAAKDQPMGSEERAHLDGVMDDMSRRGLRVLALAMKEGGEKTQDPAQIRDLVCVGLVGMKDALRPEVEGAMKKAMGAGIRVVMITGDYALTAVAIAEEAGIWRPGDLVVTGAQMDDMTDEELVQQLDRVSVFARVTPEHKLRIIRGYRSRKEVVVMTGDGVNDAPSLVAADLGVAMGRIGTEVAKEAADIVLVDDNFGSIVSAVEEGRSIYRTIKKVILYLFSTSAGEVLTIVGAVVIGYPLPLLAAQIIWLNFVTDGFLDVALAMEPREPGLLSGKFERPKKYLVDLLTAERIAVMALPMAIGTLLLFRQYYPYDMMKAWTVSLTTLAVFQWFNAWNCRHESKSLFQMNPFSNKFLIGATCIIISLQLLAVYHPIMQKFLRTVPLELSEWLVIIPIAASVVLVEEIRKFFYRRKASIPV